MKVLDILKGARELIATPEQWSKGQGARSARNEPRNWNDPDVCKRCLFIAIAEMAGDFGGETAATVAMGFRSITEMILWNDSPDRAHEEVIARLDKAIETIEKQ